MATETNNSQQQRGMVRATRSPLGSVLVPGDLFRMNPFSLMRRMSEEMDRVFGDLHPGRGDSNAVWAPPIEVSQRDGAYLVRAELPGINSADVKVEVTGDAVILQGERKMERDETKEGVHLSERMYGRFARVIPIPEGAKTDQANAKFDNGVLEITVPLTEQRSQAREIPIQASEAAPAQQPAGANKAA